MTHHYFFGTLGSSLVNCKHVVDYSQQRIEGWLDGVATIDSYIAMENFLENFSIGYESLAVANKAFQQTLRVGFMGMRRPH